MWEGAGSPIANPDDLALFPPELYRGNEA
jgi:hypothetical protein